MQSTEGQDTDSRGRPRVLVVAPSIVATFTQQDADILGRSFETELFSHKATGSLRDMSRRIARSDAVLIWFAGRHAVPAMWLARRHKKPVTVIIGGYEAKWIPELRYGIDPHSWRAKVLRWIVTHADRVVAVSETTQKGIQQTVPRVAGNVRLVYNAVDSSVFTINDSANRQGVLCVGILSAHTLELKGWKLFWKAAAAMPETPFVAVGPVFDKVARDFVAQTPPNLQWLGGLYGDDLLRQYQKASVYFQGSRHESFSLSLAEGMACGCIPVVTRYGALPEVAGDLGFYCEERTPESAAKAIRAALNAPPEHRLAARQRMIDLFDVEIRRTALTAIVEETLSQ